VKDCQPSGRFAARLPFPDSLAICVPGPVWSSTSGHVLAARRSPCHSRRASRWRRSPRNHPLRHAGEWPFRF